MANNNESEGKGGEGAESSSEEEDSEEEEEEGVSLADETYTEMRCHELRALLRARGLGVSGVKAVLIGRLQAADDAS